jgi:hypothetical protein
MEKLKTANRERSGAVSLIRLFARVENDLPKHKLQTRQRQVSRLTYKKETMSSKMKTKTQQREGGHDV